jgi:hypothetical protein
MRAALNDLGVESDDCDGRRRAGSPSFRILESTAAGRRKSVGDVTIVVATSVQAPSGTEGRVCGDL